MKLLFITLFLVLFVQLVHSRVPNCRPLPQCCRRHVFSPACRGVVAKRSFEDYLRDNGVTEDDYGGLRDDDVALKLLQGSGE